MANINLTKFCFSFRLFYLNNLKEYKLTCGTHSIGNSYFPHPGYGWDIGQKWDRRWESRMEWVESGGEKEPGGSWEKRVGKRTKERGGSQRTIWGENAVWHNGNRKNVVISSGYIFILNLTYSKISGISIAKYVLRYYDIIKEFWEKCLNIWKYWTLAL